MLEQEDPDRAAPDQPGEKSIPTADERPAGERRQEQREEDQREEELRDDLQPAIVEEVLGVALPLGASALGEEPAAVRVPEAPQRLADAIPVPGMRAVGVAVAVRELMVLPVMRRPT